MDQLVLVDQHYPFVLVVHGDLWDPPDQVSQYPLVFLAVLYGQANLVGQNFL